MAAAAAAAAGAERMHGADLCRSLWSRGLRAAAAGCRRQQECHGRGACACGCVVVFAAFSCVVTVWTVCDLNRCAICISVFKFRVLTYLFTLWFLRVLCAESRRGAERVRKKCRFSSLCVRVCACGNGSDGMFSAQACDLHFCFHFS